MKEREEGLDERVFGASDLVAGDEEEFEEIEPGIRVRYRLKTEEVHEVLKRTRFYKKAWCKAKIETAVLGLMTVLFGVTWIVNNDINAMIFAIVSAGLIGLVWATPYFSLRSQSIKWAGQDEIELDVYPHEIRVSQGAGQLWEVPLDGSVPCEQYKDLLVLHTGETELLVVPLRSLDPNCASDVEARILAGTRAVSLERAPRHARR